MNTLLDTTKALGTIDIDGTSYEVCAEAEATHDRASSRLTVELRAFLRTLEHTHLGETHPAAWLPAPDTVTEHVEREEAMELAKDVFASWCHKVERAMPGT